MTATDITRPTILGPIRKTEHRGKGATVVTSHRTEADVTDAALVALTHDFRREMKHEVVAAREALYAEHFADTPLALASIRRTGIVPWPVDFEVWRDEPSGDQTFRVREFTRIVERERRGRELARG